MSLKNDFEISSKHLKVIGNESTGYRVIYRGKIVKYTRSFSLAMDVLFALLIEDYDALWKYGISAEEMIE